MKSPRSIWRLALAAGVALVSTGAGAATVVYTEINPDVYGSLDGVVYSGSLTLTTTVVDPEPAVVGPFEAGLSEIPGYLGEPVEDYAYELSGVSVVAAFAGQTVTLTDPIQLFATDVNYPGLGPWAGVGFTDLSSGADILDTLYIEPATYNLVTPVPYTTTSTGGYNPNSSFPTSGGTLEINYVGGETTYCALAPGSVCSVPEPASWMMMIVGVAAQGAILRTRRRRLSPVRIA